MLKMNLENAAILLGALAVGWVLVENFKRSANKQTLSNVDYPSAYEQGTNLQTNGTWV